jgi:hypothetical protein
MGVFRNCLRRELVGMTALAALAADILTSRAKRE